MFAQTYNIMFRYMLKVSLFEQSIGLGDRGVYESLTLMYIVYGTLLLLTLYIGSQELCVMHIGSLTASSALVMLRSCDIFVLSILLFMCCFLICISL